NEGGRGWRLRNQRAQRWVPALELLEDRTVPSFLAPVNFYSGPLTTTLAVGDFNGDGIPDLASLSSSGLGVFLGNGDGPFQPPIYTATVTGPFTIADLTGNGLSDLVTKAPDGNLGVFLGNGDGTFQPPLELPGTTAPGAWTVGDLNGD